MNVQRYLEQKQQATLLSIVFGTWQKKLTMLNEEREEVRQCSEVSILYR